jgi:hypothetical protein
MMLTTNDGNHIGTTIHDQFKRAPTVVTGQDLCANNRPDDSIVALKPFATKPHSFWPPFPLECSA